MPSASHKIFWENLVSLYVVQAANYLLPLITLPYLIRVLGIDRFGLLSFSFALIQYFIVITDYGFNLTATRQVSTYKNNPEGLRSIFWTTLFVKTLLMFVCFLILSLIIITIPRFRQDALLFIMYFISVIGNAIFPAWFLQGLERMKSMSIINLTTKVIATISIFIFIKQPTHVIWVALIQSASVVMSGMLSLMYIFINYNMPLKVPGIRKIWESLSDGWPVFVTMLSSSLVNNTMVFVLGLFAPNQTVGIFAMSEKIIRLGINLVGPVSVALFPRVSQLFYFDKTNALRLLRKILAIGSIGFVIVSSILFVGANLIVRLVSGIENNTAAILIRIMAVLPLTIFIDNIYGTQILLNIGCEKQFMLAVLLPGVASLILSFMIVPIWHAYATAVIFLIAELAILTAMIISTRSARCYLIKDNWL